MRRRISIRGFVRPSVRPSVRRSVTPSLRRLLGASYAEYSALFKSCRLKLTLKIVTNHFPVTKELHGKSFLEVPVATVCSFFSLFQAPCLPLSVRSPLRDALRETEDI